MTVTPVVTDEGFAKRVRTATLPEHEAAENSTFMSALTDGQLSRDAYAALLGQTYFVYDVLEQAGEAQRTDPVAGALVFDELIRLPALRRDLEFLIGPDWESNITPLPATQSYCERLREVAFTSSGGFVAHHYTRYLGDLSGGQILRRLMGRHYDLTDDGLRFYTFDGIEKVKPFRDAYRTLLDEAAWNDGERDQVVAEVSVAFTLNTALFADLARGLDGWRLTTAPTAPAP